MQTLYILKKGMNWSVSRHPHWNHWLSPPQFPVPLFLWINLAAGWHVKDLCASVMFFLGKDLPLNAGDRQWLGVQTPLERREEKLINPAPIIWALPFKLSYFVI